MYLGLSTAAHLFTVKVLMLHGQICKAGERENKRGVEVRSMSEVVGYNSHLLDILGASALTNRKRRKSYIGWGSKMEGDF